MTGFTNTEEQGVGLTHIVPLLVEDELRAKGGRYSKGDDWASYGVADGLVIPRQNPASSAEAAELLLSKVGR